MQTLKIKWQRLISEGETCPRCSTTGEEVEKAVSSLKKSLRPLGIKIVFNKEELSVKEFKEAPLQSNMIIINDQPLEKWIDGEVGESQCCDVCGPTDCRTTIVDGETYEEIPAELIIKAGLIAASSIVGSKESESCCDNNSTGKSNSCCC
jgi:hypothetical protein